MKQQNQNCDTCDRKELLEIISTLRMNTNLDSASIIELKAKIEELKRQVIELQEKAK